MHRTMFPGYTVGADAYDDIAGVCGQYGRKAVIIGGEKALAAAKDKILKAIEGSKIEITGVYWYGGEASLENVEMLRPKAAASMGAAIHQIKMRSVHSTARRSFPIHTQSSTKLVMP